jgi:hypothetical protein
MFVLIYLKTHCWSHELLFVGSLVQVPADIDSDEEVPFAVRNQVRGQKTMRLLTGENALRDMGFAALLADPIAKYRDRVDYANVVSSSIENTSLEPDQHLRQRTVAAAAAANRGLLSGSVGRESVKAFACMMREPFEDQSWALFEISFTEESLTKAMFTLAQGLADTWRRLVHPFECYPWVVLTNAALQPQQFQECLSRARNDQRRCPQCVDASYTNVLLEAEDAGTDMQHILSFSTDVLATLKVSSINVENQHVYYQEVSHKGMRSRCKLPGTIQTQTYLAAVRVAHARLKRVTQKKHALCLVQFQSF